jgi:hypothetical protein
MKLHAMPKAKRKPSSDCTAQLQLLGLNAIEGSSTTFENDEWLVTRDNADPDYPWRLTRKGAGEPRRCSSQGEIVEIIRRDQADRLFSRGQDGGAK